MATCRRGTFLTYHGQLASVNTEVDTWVVFENSGNGLDKVLVTYSQVESNQFKFPHVGSNCMWLFKPLYFIVIII